MVKATSLTYIPFAPPQREEWQDAALCAQTDPEIFFPNKGGTTIDAKATCLRCTVQFKCLRYALEDEDSKNNGVWGGLSSRERKRLLKVMEEDPSLTLIQAYNEITSTWSKKGKRRGAIAGKPASEAA